MALTLSSLNEWTQAGAANVATLATVTGKAIQGIQLPSLHTLVNRGRERWNELGSPADVPRQPQRLIDHGLFSTVTDPSASYADRDAAIDRLTDTAQQGLASLNAQTGPVLGAEGQQELQRLLTLLQMAKPPARLTTGLLKELKQFQFNNERQRKFYAPGTEPHKDIR